MSRSVITIVAAAVAVLVGVVVVMQGAQSPSTSVTPTPAPSSDNGAIYTMAQVEEHGDASSCWTVINGNVYDLTAWISQHPGGERAVLSLCGGDGSAAFNGQHGSFEQAQQALAGYKIGTLTQ